MALSESEQLKKVNAWITKDAKEMTAISKEVTHVGTFVRANANAVRALVLKEKPLANPLQCTPVQVLPGPFGQGKKQPSVRAPSKVKKGTTRAAAKTQKTPPKSTASRPPKRAVVVRKTSQAPLTQQQVAQQYRAMIASVQSEYSSPKGTAKVIVHPAPERPPSKHPTVEPRGKGKWVVLSATGRPLGSHRTKEKARKQQVAIIISQKKAQQKAQSA